MKTFLKNYENLYILCISLQIYAGVATRRLAMLVSSFKNKYIPVLCVDAKSVVGH
jgi:hypothetical protein